MFWLKQCPKCAGDLYQESDIFGSYVACLQCGRHCIPSEGVHSAQVERPDGRNAPRNLPKPTIQARRDAVAI